MVPDRKPFLSASQTTNEYIYKGNITREYRTNSKIVSWLGDFLGEFGSQVWAVIGANHYTGSSQAS